MGYVESKQCLSMQNVLELESKSTFFAIDLISLEYCELYWACLNVAVIFMLHMALEHFCRQLRSLSSVQTGFTLLPPRGIVLNPVKTYIRPAQRIKIYNSQRDL